VTPGSANCFCAKSGVGEALPLFDESPSYYFILAKQILADAGTWIFLAGLPLYLLENFHLKLGEAGFAGRHAASLARHRHRVRRMVFRSRAAGDPTRRMATSG